MTATVAFSRTSCGYVGKSDGWTDLHENFQMDYEFDHAAERKYCSHRRTGSQVRPGNLRLQRRSDKPNIVRLPIYFNP